MYKNILSFFILGLFVIISFCIVSANPYSFNLYDDPTTAIGGNTTNNYYLNPDGNASSICDGDEVLLGNGSCQSSSGFGGGLGMDYSDIALTNQSNSFTGNQSTDSWWNGKFNWVVSFVNNYIFGSFDGETLTIDFNETKLNETIDARAGGVGGNSSWNESYANTLYLGINDQSYNETELILSINTTTNIQSLGFYNTSEIDILMATLTNLSFNQSLTDTLYYLISNPKEFINITQASVFNDTTLILNINSSIWDYINNNENNWLSTYNATYDTWAYNQTVLYYSDEIYINKNLTNSFNFNETKLNQTILDFTGSMIYNASLINTYAGTLTSGDIDSILLAEDGDVYNVTEGSGSPPVSEIIVNFTGVTEFNTIIGRWLYMGGSGHKIDLEVWNYNTNSWQQHGNEITDMDNYAYANINIPDGVNHIENGIVSVRFNHLDNGNPSHQFSLDYLSLVDGFTSIVSTQHDALSGRNNILVNHPNIIDIFYNKTEIDSNNNSWSSTFNETYAGLINNASYLSTYNQTYQNFIDNEGNFNVNSSEYWNTNEGFLNNVIDILGSWITNDQAWLNFTQISNNFFNKTEITLMIEGNITTLRNDIDSNFIYLSDLKLNKTDQSYNETDLILSVNTTSNIESLGFYNTTDSDDRYINTIGNEVKNDSLTINGAFRVNDPNSTAYTSYFETTGVISTEWSR